MKHKKKKRFLAANPPDVFGANRHTKYPMSTVTYTAGSYMLRACFICILFRYIVLWILTNTNR